MPVDYAEQRKKMVDGQLRTTDVSSAAILDAMLRVPREAFVPSSKRELAYIDEDIEISTSNAPRYLMEPSPFAKLLQLADIRKEDVILDVGCGSGYSTAILSCLGGSVIALECDAELAASATAVLTDLGFDNAAVVEGRLQDGYASEAPFDVIFLNGAVSCTPETLLDQLKEGGRLVAVSGTGNTGTAMLWTRSSGSTSSRRQFNAAIPPLPGFEREAAFEF